MLMSLQKLYLLSLQRLRRLPLPRDRIWACQHRSVLLPVLLGFLLAAQKLQRPLLQPARFSKQAR